MIYHLAWPGVRAGDSRTYSTTAQQVAGKIPFRTHLQGTKHWKAIKECRLLSSDPLYQLSGTE